jgi:hypothetical protein
VLLAAVAVVAVLAIRAMAVLSRPENKKPGRSRASHVVALLAAEPRVCVFLL